VLRIRAPFLASFAIPLVASLTYAGGTISHAAAATPRETSWISPSAMQQAKTAGLLFVADTNNHVVDIYSLKKPTSPIGQIKGLLSLPTALAVDKSGDLFVYEARANAILEFAPPYTHPPVKTFFDTGQQANGIAVDANDNVYSANGIYEDVIEYVHGKSRGKEIPLPVQPNAVTVDALGDLVCTFNGNGAGGVFTKTGGSPIPKNLLIPLEVNPGDVLLDEAGNLVVEDTSAGTINVYRSGSRRPSKKISDGFVNALHMAFNANRQILYVADYGNGSNGSIKAIGYASGAIQWQISGFAPYSPQGVAVTPAAVP
jgi:DNA-binding beta-propeller fold protein YncE